MKNWLQKWLGINELEAFIHKSLEHLLGGVSDANRNVSLIDGRMRELELALFLMSTDECAEYLGVSKRTVTSKLVKGELIGKKVGHCWVVTKLELLRYENRVKERNRLAVENMDGGIGVCIGEE